MNDEQIKQKMMRGEELTDAERQHLAGAIDSIQEAFANGILTPDDLDDPTDEG